MKAPVKIPKYYLLWHFFVWKRVVHTLLWQYLSCCLKAERRFDPWLLDIRGCACPRNNPTGITGWGQNLFPPFCASRRTEQMHREMHAVTSLHVLDESVETLLVLLLGHTKPRCAPSSFLQCLETSLLHCKVNRKLFGTLLRIMKNRLLVANKNYLYEEQ